MSSALTKKKSGSNPCTHTCTKNNRLTYPRSITPIDLRPTPFGDDIDARLLCHASRDRASQENSAAAESHANAPVHHNLHITRHRRLDAADKEVALRPHEDFVRVLRFKGARKTRQETQDGGGGDTHQLKRRLGINDGNARYLELVHFDRFVEQNRRASGNLREFCQQRSCANNNGRHSPPLWRSNRSSWP